MVNFSYSTETHGRVADYIETGLSNKQVHELTKVSERSLRRWRNNLTRWGQIVSPRRRGGAPKIRLWMEEVSIAAFLF